MFKVGILWRSLRPAFRFSKYPWGFSVQLVKYRRFFENENGRHEFTEHVSCTFNFETNTLVLAAPLPYDYSLVLRADNTQVELISRTCRSGCTSRLLYRDGMSSKLVQLEEQRRQSVRTILSGTQIDAAALRRLATPVLD